jgi:hypothetical protein
MSRGKGHKPAEYRIREKLTLKQRQHFRTLLYDDLHCSEWIRQL